MSPFHIVVETIVHVAFALQHRGAGHFQQASLLRSAGVTYVMLSYFLVNLWLSIVVLVLLGQVMSAAHVCTWCHRWHQGHRSDVLMCLWQNILIQRELKICG